MTHEPAGEPIHAPGPLLDDIDAMRALDPSGVMGLTTGFADQCREAVGIASAFDAGQTGQLPIHNVVVTCLGGSAIGADLLRCVMEECGGVPVSVNRDYDLPAFVGPSTLVIASSYSGNTEETLSAYESARERGAQIACITSGGELTRRASADGMPVISVPGGQPPRTATGFLFFGMLAVVARRRLLARALAGNIDETLFLLERLSGEYGPDVPTARNPAKQLALQLHERVPVIYGSQGYRGVVALRWKGQINENAKAHAFANVFPEMNHNEILAWEQCGRQAGRWSIVYLRDTAEKLAASRVGRRVEVTKRIVGSAAQQHEAWAQGESLLARMFSLFSLGDFVSVYMAYLNGVDPALIAGIDRLKAEMAELK